MTQHSGKLSDFIEVKTYLQMYLLRIILFIKTAVSSIDCWILDLKLLQAFATVSLLKDPITSFIFWIRSLVLLPGFALAHNSDSPHSKK
jgi:hypothetical protein